MTTRKRWTVEILIDEEDEDCITRAVARLDTSDDRHLHGHGGAHRGPGDDFSEIGDDVAVAAALSELARKLARKAVGVQASPADA